jgi:alpha-galactosidase
MEDYSSIIEKWPFAQGTSTVLKVGDKIVSLDLSSLEYSSVGRGDYNEPSIILKDDGGYVFDFTYNSYKVEKKKIEEEPYPVPKGECEILSIYLFDEKKSLKLTLNYYIFQDSDVIARNVYLESLVGEVEIDKLMSMQLELINDGYESLNLYGSWASEAHLSFKDVTHGIFINDSKTGLSSNRHNPLLILKSKKADYDHGNVYGFNFIYSGNHYEMLELTPFEKVRIQVGINPFCYKKVLKSGESLSTPIAIMTYSNEGLNGLAYNFHKFVNERIIPPYWANHTRPIVINNREVTGMKFKETNLLDIVKEAKSLGVEMFVLDDGWFKGRNDDHGGLSNYEVDTAKLPHGIDGLGKKVEKLGSKFGLWFEPEMVSEDTPLFKEHPEWVVTSSYGKRSYGRNQLVLNLAIPGVRDYIVDNISKILSSGYVSYVKWDCNRNMSDFEEKDDLGTFFDDYVIGLYDVLKRLTDKFPEVLFEGCASGGNRFDLGILSYMPQIWTSDDTDAFERLSIQSGIFLGYPQSCVSNHVSSFTSQQLLRKIPLATRFNVASFGVFGYEVDLASLSKVERSETLSEIKFYKKYRSLFQFGRLYQLANLKDDGYYSWEVIDKDRSVAIIGYFASLQTILHKTTRLRGLGFEEEATYRVETVRQKLNLKMFGNLINYVSKMHLKEEGFILNYLSKIKAIDSEKEIYTIKGKVLNEGLIKLFMERSSAGYNDEVRILGDFGSRIYLVTKGEK